MRAVRVTAKTGEEWTTSINGTEEEIKSYFLDKWFNIGSVDDHMVQVSGVEFLETVEAKS